MMLKVLEGVCPSGSGSSAYFRTAKVFASTESPLR
jgi:hypothetical protein